MSIYTDSNNNINRYFLEIEKYLPQLRNNPYISELEEDIINQKKKKLYNCISKQYHTYIESLYKSTVHIIFEKIYSQDNFSLLEKLFSDIEHKKITSINHYITTYINKHTYIPAIHNTLKSTDIRISTMTICCFLDKLIDLKQLYTQYIPPYNININNFNTHCHKLHMFDIIGCKYSTLPNKGYFKKNSNRSFYNSASLNIFIHKDKQINFKIFKNGKIQITGIPKPEIAKKCIDAFIKYIYKQNIIDSMIQYNNFRTVLINSDYFCGIQINRENLFKIMTQKLNLIVSYESENYPGVKFAYFYNTNNIGTPHDGKCVCETKCKGKGKSSLLENMCKRITISIFQSGKIIITGANSEQQIHHAYNCINKIIKDHYHFVIKHNNIEVKTYKIKISAITNYDDYAKLTAV